MPLGVREGTYCPSFIVLSLQIVEITFDGSAQTLTLMPSTKNQNFENSFFVCHSVYVKVLIAQFSWS